MKLKVLNSNSAGNCYVLEGEHQALLLECGVHPRFVKQALDFNISKIVGCLVTHEHMDHFQYANQIASFGIDLYGSPGTLKNHNGHRFYEIMPLAQFNVGGFTVFPFPVVHDARQPYGYLIKHEECGNILFLTDSAYTEYRFPGINHIIVEANNSRALLEEKVLSGKMQYFIYKRLVESHMSIEVCEKLLLANDLQNVYNIVLIHLSNANSIEAEFKKTIEEKTGKIVHIATAGKIINLSLNSF